MGDARRRARALARSIGDMDLRARADLAREAAAAKTPAPEVKAQQPEPGPLAVRVSTVQKMALMLIEGALCNLQVTAEQIGGELGERELGTEVAKAFVHLKKVKERFLANAGPKVQLATSIPPLPRPG